MDLRRSCVIFLLSAIFSVLITFTGISVVTACTLWAAAGKSVAHRGCLIAKNRDWTPEPSEIQFVRSTTGLRLLGLMPIRDGAKTGIVAGVNEKGLVVVTATAGGIPQTDREKGGRGLARQLLTVFSTVAEVLENRSVFSRTHPSIYLIADRRRTAWIEVAPEGKYAFRATNNGILTHTNHYLDEKLSDANGKIDRGSRTRLGRIGELLDRHSAPLTLEDFIAFSQDRNDGPDHSLWRTGSKPEGKRTLASWIVSLPPNAPPELFLSLANPGEPERTVRITLDETFWKGNE